MNKNKERKTQEEVEEAIQLQFQVLENFKRNWKILKKWDTIFLKNANQEAERLLAEGLIWLIG